MTKVIGSKIQLRNAYSAVFGKDETVGDAESYFALVKHFGGNLDKCDAFIQEQSNNPDAVVETASATTECGKTWINVSTSCVRCNTIAGIPGAHVHFDNGNCETEPCYKHGGPA